jgi:hypothetical protein
VKSETNEVITVIPQKYRDAAKQEKHQCPISLFDPEPSPVIEQHEEENS